MSTRAVSELRLRMIEDMKARQLNPHTQRSHIYSCKRFAGYLKRSPETATADEVRAFQVYLIFFSGYPAEHPQNKLHGTPPEQASRKSKSACATDRCGCALT
jgi:hypothetical protein